MNIGEAIKILKQEPDFSLNYYNRENAIDVLLTAYEKEKEKNKLLEENYNSAHEDINWFCENYISKKESEQKERKAWIKGTNDADELCNKKWEDKIKAKIEELDKMKSNGKYTVLFNSDNVMEVVKAVLQSLLEKE